MIETKAKLIKSLKAIKYTFLNPKKALIKLYEEHESNTNFKHTLRLALHSVGPWTHWESTAVFCCWHIFGILKKTKTNQQQNNPALKSLRSGHCLIILDFLKV